MGFRVIDELADRFSVERWKNKHGARQAFIPQARLLLVQPTSYMNASGVPLRVIASWHRIPPESILIISDDLDLPIGKLRLRAQGGHGGHNGLRSVIATLGNTFPRLRVGVGRPAGESIEHVLGPFTAQESSLLPEIVAAGAQGAQVWLDDGIERAMQFVNSWTAAGNSSGAGGHH